MTNLDLQQVQTVEVRKNDGTIYCYIKGAPGTFQMEINILTPSGKMASAVRVTSLDRSFYYIVREEEL